MCRHLAYLGPPRSLASLVFDPPHSLEVQSYRPKHQPDVTLNADGWGVGWWDHDLRPEPARYRTATQMWADRALRSAAELVHASAIVAATRAATPPSPVVDTGNAPFAAGPWLFSLNGFVVGHDGPVGERLRRAVSPERAEGIEGTSDAEVLFALVLDRLDAGAPPAEAVAAVVADVRALGPARLNLLLADGRSVVATTCAGSLFSLTDAGLAQGGVLLASEPLDDHPAWMPVPDGSLVEARGTTVEISSLAPGGARP
jgi:glutamine amidotransferase